MASGPPRSQTTPTPQPRAHPVSAPARLRNVHNPILSWSHQVAAEASPLARHHTAPESYYSPSVRSADDNMSEASYPTTRYSYSRRGTSPDSLLTEEEEPRAPPLGRGRPPLLSKSASMVPGSPGYDPRRDPNMIRVSGRGETPDPSIDLSNTNLYRYGYIYGARRPSWMGSATGSEVGSQMGMQRMARRTGRWNRRGDRLTLEGAIIPAPNGETFPPDLAGYPLSRFMDENGRIY